MIAMTFTKVTLIIFEQTDFLIIFFQAREWYLSGYGNNTADCGDSRENACKTLDHLLGLFHKRSFKQNQTLVLITNETLLINTKLMVRKNIDVCNFFLHGQASNV